METKKREKKAKRPRKLKKKIKSLVVRCLAFPLIIRGFIGEEAHRWVKQVYWSYRSRSYSFAQTRWAVKHGFTPGQVERMGINKNNYQNFVSRKEYAFLRPLNGIYSKWLTDIVSVHAIFKPYRNVMPACYYQINKRDGKTQIIPLYDRSAGDTMDDVMALLREKGRLKVKSSSRAKSWSMSYRDGKYRLNGKTLGEKQLQARLRAFPGIAVITEDVFSSKEFAGSRLKLIIYNEQGDNPRIGDAYVRFRPLKPQKNNSKDTRKALFFRVDTRNGTLSLAEYCKGMKQVNPTNGSRIPEKIPCWKEIAKTVDSMCRFAPQLEFFGMDIVITRDGFKIVRMRNHPSYPSVIPFSKKTTAYLKKKVKQKSSVYTFSRRLRNCGKRIKLGVRATFSKIFFPKTLLPYLSVRWIHDVWKDFRTNKDTTLKEKLWAIRHGFISYRLHQYGITEENWKDYISDFEYKWLRHINGKYRHWMEDKITVKYICSEYNECFPEYYYHISLKNGNNKVLPMMDCPPGYSHTYEDIFRLVREKGSLALKPDEGSHGDGFYKLSYADGKYYLNHEEAQEQDVLNILQDVKNQYLVTEYIDMHDEIKRIYSGAVNTIRMIVFKKDGKNPVIGNAYMRFGSQRTGAVDNMGAGGMYARVDVETGRFYDAKIIEANEIKPCLYHPDTHVKIEGYLPNWEKVKQDVLDVARSIPQLEYFGFDLALTADGLKFPEINRFPDYPAIEKYSRETIDFLLYKLAVKKHRYGYDVSRGHTLVKLPRR